MTEKNKEFLSNQSFHNWKNHECTKALVNILETAKEYIEKNSLEYCLSDKKLTEDNVYFLRGAYKEIDSLLETINGDNAKKLLEEVIKEAENDKTI